MIIDLINAVVSDYHKKYLDDGVKYISYSVFVCFVCNISMFLILVSFVCMWFFLIFRLYYVFDI